MPPPFLQHSCVLPLGFEKVAGGNEIRTLQTPNNSLQARRPSRAAARAHERLFGVSRGFPPSPPQISRRRRADEGASRPRRGGQSSIDRRKAHVKCFCERHV